MKTSQSHIKTKANNRNVFKATVTSGRRGTEEGGM